MLAVAILALTQMAFAETMVDPSSPDFKVQMVQVKLEQCEKNLAEVQTKLNALPQNKLKTSALQACSLYGDMRTIQKIDADLKIPFDMGATELNNMKAQLRRCPEYCDKNNRKSIDLMNEKYARPLERALKSISEAEESLTKLGDVRCLNSLHAALKRAQTLHLERQCVCKGEDEKPHGTPEPGGDSRSDGQ